MESCDNYRLNNVSTWAVAVEDGNALCRARRLSDGHPEPGRSGERDRLVPAGRGQAAAALFVPAAGLPFDGMDEGLRQRTVDLRLSGRSRSRGPPVRGGARRRADRDQHWRRRTTRSGSGGGICCREPYRTVLGHFRHESGHFYWDRLIRDTPRIEEFRRLFGDERSDYDASAAGVIMPRRVRTGRRSS